MEITPLHTFGWQKEQDLLTRMETDQGLKMYKRQERFSVLDFDTSKRNHFVELKSRTTKHWRQNVGEWFVPSCKVKNLNPKQSLTLYYYWANDDTLWRLDYDAQLFAGFREQVPEHHTERHLYIPDSVWSFVGNGSPSGWMGED